MGLIRHLTIVLNWSVTYRVPVFEEFHLTESVVEVAYSPASFLQHRGIGILILPPKTVYREAIV